MQWLQILTGWPVLKASFNAVILQIFLPISYPVAPFLKNQQYPFSVFQDKLESAVSFSPLFCTHLNTGEWTGGEKLEWSGAGCCWSVGPHL